MADIVLYSAAQCPYAQRVRIALAEKHLGFMLEEVDLDNPSPEFLARSPWGKVPMLCDGDQCIVESSIINEYLEDRWPAPALLPGTPAERARARFWVDFVSVRLAPAYYKLLLEQDPAGQVRRRDAYSQLLAFIEGEALHGHDGPFLLGAALTLADLTLYPFIERQPALTHYRQLPAVSAQPRLAAWAQRMAQRPSVSATARDAGFHIANYARYANDSARGVTAAEMRDA